MLAEIEGHDVSGGFVTQFEVIVRDAQGAPISGATVTVRNSSLGTVNLLELDAGSGEYEATVNSFVAGDYRLDVTRGSDEVRGVVIGGMSAHQITSPLANDTVAANEPLAVTWTRPSEAAGAEIATQEFEAEGPSRYRIVYHSGEHEPGRGGTADQGLAVQQGGHCGRPFRVRAEAEHSQHGRTGGGAVMGLGGCGPCRSS